MMFHTSFLKNQFCRAIRAIKTLLQFNLRVFFVILGISLFGWAGPSLAFIIEDFDDYTLGQRLNGIGYWGTTTNPAEVRSENYVSFPHSAFFDSDNARDYGKFDLPIIYRVNDIQFDFVWENVDFTYDMVIGLSDDNLQAFAQLNCVTPITATTSKIAIITSIGWKTLDFVIELGTWYDFVWEQELIDGLAYQRISIDGGLTFSPYYTTWKGDVRNIKRITFMAQLDGLGYYDNIAIPPIEGITSLLNPISPTNCERSIVNFDNVLLEGNISIPDDNNYTYDNLLVYFESAYTPATTTALTISYFDIPLPNLTKNETFDYSATTTLSRNSPFWSIRYRLEGFDEWGKRFVDWYVPEQIPCNTILTELPEIPLEMLEEIGLFDLPELENCEGLEITERLLCEIKNTFSRIFLPSQGKVAELNQNIQLLKQKFPFNYLNISSIFYGDIKNEIQATSTIPFKILGNNGNVNFAVWENTANLAGSSQKLSSIFKGFFSFIFLAGFITWGISFGKRIFK